LSCIIRFSQYHVQYDTSISQVSGGIVMAKLGICFKLLVWYLANFVKTTTLTFNFKVLQESYQSEVFEWARMNHKVRLQKLTVRFPCIQRINKIQHYSGHPNKVRRVEQWSSAYYTPMQENSCCKLPQLSN